MADENNLGSPEVIEEITKLVGNVTKIGTDVVTKQVGPFVEKGFDTFIGILQGVLSKDNINKVLELKDTILGVLEPIFMPIIGSMLGIAKKPMGSSDESVLDEVEEVISTLVMTGVTIAVVTILPELAHPLKQMGLGRITPMIVQMGGFDRISASIMNILVERTMGARLRYATNSLFTPYQPNQQDLINFTVREVLTPEQLAGYLKKLGFSSEWADRYWRAHWELVGVRNLYDMFHRGLITRDDMKKMLVRHDFDTKDEISDGRFINWPEKLMDLSQRLVPRVDIRYAWEAGLIDDAEMLRRMKLLGYSDEDAVIESVIQRRRTLTSEIGDVRRETLRDFREGMITEVAARANLEVLGDTIQAIDFRMEAATYYLERDHKLGMLSEIIKALGRGDITEEAAKTRLVDMKIQTWRIEQIIELAALKLSLKPEDLTYTTEY